MTRFTRISRTSAEHPARWRGRATVGSLLALAVVSTAGAPSVIRISAGDTLWDLAREHRTTVSALRALNDLPGHGTIYAGEMLRVPGSTAAATRTREQSYVVRSGDTLSHLAVRFGTTTSALRTRNKLSGSTLQIGQRLAVPGRAVAGLAGTGKPQRATAVPTTNAGVRIPELVRRSVAQNRATLAARSHPSKAAVRRMVAATARRHGVSPSLALAVAFQESGFQQRVVSPVNAIGVMQVLPLTGRVLAQQHNRRLDLLNTQDNVTAGVLLLRQLDRSTRTTNQTLAGYYQGLGSISRQGILPQTHRYIRNVTILRARFANG